MSDERKDPPIEPQTFLGGVNVVDFGDLRVARGFSRRPFSGCHHHRLVYDGSERRVWCQDCERDIDGFDAFRMVAERFHSTREKLDDRERKVAEAEAHNLISLAAKTVDSIWRSRNKVPACPVCGFGLFPEDFKNGRGTQLGRDYGAATRAKHNKPVPGYKARGTP